MKVSLHPARAIDNHVLHSGSAHGEILIPVSALVLPRSLSFPEVFHVDIGVHGAFRLHMPSYLYVADREQRVVIGTERPFPRPSGVPISVGYPSAALVTVFPRCPPEQGLEPKFWVL